MVVRSIPDRRFERAGADLWHAAPLPIHDAVLGATLEVPTLEPAIEYAARMRRFASAKLMDSLLARSLVTPAHIDCLAATLARFHASLPPAPPASAFGTPQAIRAPAQQNFEQLAPLLDADYLENLERLRTASEQEYAGCAPRFEQRREQGWNANATATCTWGISC